ncbi:MAG: archease [Bacillota bacterium]
MSRRYEVLDHTADIGLRAYGKTLEEAFLNMTLGMISLIVPEKGCVLSREERRVEAGAAGLEGLLVAWLSEFVYLVDAERFLPAEIELPHVAREVSSDDGLVRWTISATVRGERVDPTRHGMELEIKGVSYHLLKIEKLDEVEGKTGLEPGGGWVAQAIFDV